MIPKIIAVGITLIIMMPFIMAKLASFSTDVFLALADAVH